MSQRSRDLLTQSVTQCQNALLVNIGPLRLVGQNHREVGPPVSPLVVQNQLQPYQQEQSIDWWHTDSVHFFVQPHTETSPRQRAVCFVCFLLQKLEYYCQHVSVRNGVTASWDSPPPPYLRSFMEHDKKMFELVFFFSKNIFLKVWLVPNSYGLSSMVWALTDKTARCAFRDKCPVRHTRLLRSRTDRDGGRLPPRHQLIQRLERVVHFHRHISKPEMIDTSSQSRVDKVSNATKTCLFHT